jgi:predicted transcriptional regulator of viral defense system
MRSTYRERAWEVAVGQYGYVSTAEAAEVGIPGLELAKLAHRGRLDHISYGLYHFAEMPATRYDPYYEAVRRVGPDAHLLDDTVLALHNLASVNPRTIRVGTRRRIRSALPDWLEVRHSEPSPAEVTTFELIPALTVATALRRCRNILTTDRFTAAIQAALHTELITPNEAAELSAKPLDLSAQLLA